MLLLLNYSLGYQPNDKFNFFFLQIHLWSYFGGTKTALLDDFDKPLECVNLFIEKKVSILHNMSMYLEFFLMVIE